MTKRETTLIVLNRGEHDYLELCLTELKKRTKPDLANFIFINNVPSVSPERADICEKIMKPLVEKDDIYIRNDPERSVTKSWNQGIKLALKNKWCKYICIANNDVYVGKDWLKIMVDILKENPHILWLFPDYHYGREMLANYQSEMKSRIELPLNAQPEMLKGFLYVCPRKTFETEIGLFDEQFITWYQDTDYWERIKKAGSNSYKTYNVLTHHFYQVTLDDMRAKEGHQIVMDQDRVRFRKKYGLPPEKVGLMT